MHSHDVIKLDGLGTVLKMKAVAGDRVEQGIVGQKDQGGPALSKPADGLLGD